MNSLDNCIIRLAEMSHIYNSSPGSVLDPQHPILINKINELLINPCPSNKRIINCKCLHLIPKDYILVDYDLDGKGKKILNGRIEFINGDKFIVYFNKSKPNEEINISDILDIPTFKFGDVISKNDNSKINGIIKMVYYSKNLNGTIKETITVEWMDLTLEDKIDSSDLKKYNSLEIYEIGDGIAKISINQKNQKKYYIYGIIKEKIDLNNYKISWNKYDKVKGNYYDKPEKQDITKDNCVKFKYKINEYISISNDDPLKNKYSYKITDYTSNQNIKDLNSLIKGYTITNTKSNDNIFETMINNKFAKFKYIIYHNPNTNKSEVGLIITYSNAKIFTNKFVIQHLNATYNHEITDISFNFKSRIIGFHDENQFSVTTDSDTPEVFTKILTKKITLNKFEIGNILKITIPNDFIFGTIKYNFGTYLITIIQNGQTADGYPYYILYGYQNFMMFESILSYFNPEVISNITSI
jgi:hypothetical protein